GATILVRRAALAHDLERYRVASSALELAQLCAREGEAEPGLFGWLEETLDLLVAGQVPPALVGIHSDLALLAVTGLEPALLHCASCGRRAEETREVPFAPAAGGRLCNACAAAARARGRALEFLPSALVRVADSLRQATPTTLAHTRLEARLAERVRAFVGRFLEYHLEARLRCRRLAPTVPHGSA
ncbi:MAG: DNA repair protein RecO C-terminal domain-containing protein, partial [Planctomycetota bacterium]